MMHAYRVHACFMLSYVLKHWCRTMLAVLSLQSRVTHVQIDEGELDIPEE